MISPSRILLAALLLLPTPALADSMSFFLKNTHPRAMAIELHSQTRATVWPGGDQVYSLEAGEQKSVPIDCEAGERICWAAWVVGDDRQSYGVGPDGDQTCENCCVICVEKTTETILLSR